MVDERKQQGLAEFVLLDPDTEWALAVDEAVVMDPAAAVDVHHLDPLDRLGRRCERWPRAHATHDADASGQQRQRAAIGNSGGNELERLALDHAHRHSGIGQGGTEQQTGMPAAHDQRFDRFLSRHARYLPQAADAVQARAQAGAAVNRSISIGS